jgi:hypothetical protein
MRTITLRQYRDRDGRLWEEVPDRSVIEERLTHTIPESAAVTRMGVHYTSVTVERAVAEYLVGPLEEVR